MRKTYPVKALVEDVNRVLARPELYVAAPGKDRDMTPAEAFRMGVAMMLEHVLFATGNYNGYGYQEGEVTWDGAEPDIADETRRIYFAPRS